VAGAEGGRQVEQDAEDYRINVPNIDNLRDRLRERALALGADYFGVADLSRVHDFVRDQGGEMMAQFPRAVSIGVVMPSAIVDRLPHHADGWVAAAYRSHGYEILNRRLDDVASGLSSTLQRAGYRLSIRIILDP
jgi:epoxyqueuosine reductase